MLPIFWRREYVRPVEEWDRLSLSSCERLLRGLYRCAAATCAVAAETPAARVSSAAVFCGTAGPVSRSRAIDRMEG